METHNHDDALAEYVKELGNIEPLSKDEEMKLFRELAGPDVRGERREIVMRRLIEGHLAQVVSIAQKHSALDVSILDLIQEGNVGLMSAITNFIEKPTGDFTDYAATRIDDAIKMRLRS